MDVTDIVRSYYDAAVEKEWRRIDNRPEFLITSRYMSRHIRPGDRVLDIGGGPGRYSLWLADRGCEVTLLDLSSGNVRFAREKAAELGLSIEAVAGDAREADRLVEGEFDRVLLMGPLYHLLEEGDRVRAVESALRLLKPGGLFFASFITMNAGMIYGLRDDPPIVTSEYELEFNAALIAGQSYAGPAFTQAFFIAQSEILPFMSRFPLKKLSLFGQESVLAPCEPNVMSQPPEVVNAWLDMAEPLAEREELLSWSEHLMYVGRKL